MQVTDPDNAKSPSHQTHRCVFDVSGPSDKHYFIISTELVLKVQGAQPIDYEKIKELSFTVTCTDSGHPPLSLSSVFLILVKGKQQKRHPTFKICSSNFSWTFHLLDFKH